MIEGKVRPEQVSLAKMNNVSLALRIGLPAFGLLRRRHDTVTIDALEGARE